MAEVNPWDTAFQSNPIGTDNLTEGDERILDTRETVQFVLAVEHDVGDVTVDVNYLDSGRHIVGSARAFFQAAAPAALLDSTNAGAWPPIAGHADRNAAATLDNGRLWVDFDDCQPYVYEFEQTAAAWTDLNANHAGAAAGWLSLWPRSQTILKRATTANDSPAVDDTLETIDGMVQAIEIPDDGRAYELTITACVKYCHSGARESAFILNETTGGGTQLDVTLHKADGGEDAGTAMLTHVDNTAVAGTLTLTAGTTYTFDVEMCTETAADLDVNPTTALAGGWDEVAVDFAGLAAVSYLKIELRPYYTAADY